MSRICGDNPAMWARRLTLLFVVASLALYGSVAGGATQVRHTVLATGNSNGIFEPCRCPANPYGGVAKRRTFVGQSRRDTPDLILVDSGDVFHPEMDRGRAELLGKAYGLMEYDAVALGDNDLQALRRWGATWFRGLAMPWVCANVDIAGADVGLRRYRIVRRGDRRIAVTGVLELSLVPAAVLEGAPEVRVSSPAEALEKLAAELQGKADGLIVLAHLPQRRANAMATPADIATVVIFGHVTRLGGDGAAIGVGQNGQHVVGIDLTMPKDGRWTTTVEAVPLDDDIENDPELWALYEAHLRQMENPHSLRPDPAPAPEPQTDENPAEPTDGPPRGRPAAIHVSFFDAPGCRHCERVRRMLDAALVSRPQIKVHTFSTTSPDLQELQEAMAAERGVSEDRRLHTPMVVVGDHVLVGEDVSAAALEETLAHYTAEGSPEPEVGEAELGDARERLTDRWRTVSLIAVVVGGFVDGFNPCSFATIILFVSFMAAAGRTRRQVIALGGSFICGVFVVYLSIGLGFAELAFAAQRMAWLNAIISYAIIAGCLVLAGLSAVDAVRAARGNHRGMILQLPKAIKRAVRSVLIRFGRTRHLVLGGLAIGGSIAVLDLACTGQVYLPIVKFVIGSASQGRGRAVWLLVAYNLSFVVPLTTLFIISLWGTSSETLAGFLRRHLCAFKTALALLFLALAGLSYLTAGG